MEPAVDADDAAVVEAAQAAARQAGIGEPAGSGRGAWWGAGLREALARGSLEVVTPRYKGAPPPRRTRGATRA